MSATGDHLTLVAIRESRLGFSIELPLFCGGSCEGWHHCWCRRSHMGPTMCSPPGDASQHTPVRLTCIFLHLEHLFRSVGCLPYSQK
jgi:hypothetical protein